MNFSHWLVTTDWHIFFEMVLSYLQALAWPAVVITAVVVFRKQIKDKIGSLESAKGGGMEAKFFKNSIQDPTVPIEAKTELAKLWISLSTVKDELELDPETVSANLETNLLAQSTLSEVFAEAKRRAAYFDLYEESREWAAKYAKDKYSINDSPTSVMTKDGVTVPDYAIAPCNEMPQVPVFISYIEDGEVLDLSRYPETRCLIISNDVTPVLSRWLTSHPQSRNIDWNRADIDSAWLEMLTHFGVIE